MSKSIISAAMLIVGILTQAQVTETRNVPSFEKIEVSDALEIIFTESNTFSVVVESPDSETAKSVQTIVKNNTLSIHRSKSGATAKVFVTAPAVGKIKATSHSRFRISNQLTTPKVSLSLASGAYFQGTIESDKLLLSAATNSEINVRAISFSITGNFTSSAKANVSGTATNVYFQTDEEALCNAKNLNAANVTIRASDQSAVLINGSGKLQLKADDMATITYRGTPQKISIDTSSVAINKTSVRENHNASQGNTSGASN